MVRAVHSWNRRVRYGTAAAAAFLVLAGCGQGTGQGETATPPQCGVAPSVAPGQLKTVVRPVGDPFKFLVIASTALPDGALLIATETNVPEAGDEATDRRPELLVLDSKGVCRPFPLPVAGGRAVTKNAVPLTSAADGTVYVWDKDASRIVSGRTSGRWSTVVEIPPELTSFQPLSAAVADDGRLYVKTDATAYRVDSGRLTPVAGTGQVLGGGLAEPAPDPGVFPRPATSLPLPILSDLAVSPDGDVVLTSIDAVYAVSPDGVMRVVADPETTDGQAAPIVARHDEDGAIVGSSLTGVTVTDAGDVLVGDTGLQRVIRVRDDESSLLADDVTALTPGDPLDEAGGRLSLLKNRGSQLALLGVEGAK